MIAIGYPQIFPAPEDGGCDVLPLATGDLAFARSINIGINDAMQGAAEEAGVEFLDTFAKTDGHDICGEDPWIAGATLANDRKGYPFHPYAEEAALVASLLEKTID